MSARVLTAECCYTSAGSTRQLVVVQLPTLDTGTLIQIDSEEREQTRTTKITKHKTINQGKKTHVSNNLGLFDHFFGPRLDVAQDVRSDVREGLRHLKGSLNYF